jgi:hypothetical protein
LLFCAEPPQPLFVRLVLNPANRKQESMMKLAAIAVFAALVATPALAQSTLPDSGSAAVTPSDPTVDARVANKDQAQQNYYRHKLDAAHAQAQADNAQAQAEQAAADRDAALNKADDDRADVHAANQ